MIRSFDIRDLPTLFRYRNEGLFLDSALLMTRGPLLFSSTLFSYLAPVTGIFTLMCQDEDEPGQILMGQMVHTAGSPFARVTFLAPRDDLECACLVELLEYLAKLAGEHNAFHILAEVDERSVAFESLRRTGFAVYARQRIWKMDGEMLEEESKDLWRPVRDRDSIEVQSLYQSLVPGLVKQIEPLSMDQLEGLVSYHEGEVIGYADLKYGHRGIWAQPILHPDVEDVDAQMKDLVAGIPERRSRPVYICARSYHSWLESVMQNMGAESGPLQAVMVKRLAVHQRVKRSFNLPHLEQRPDISAPIAQSKRNG